MDAVKYGLALGITTMRRWILQVVFDSWDFEAASVSTATE